MLRSKNLRQKHRRRDQHDRALIKAREDKNKRLETGPSITGCRSIEVTVTDRFSLCTSGSANSLKKTNIWLRWGWRLDWFNLNFPTLSSHSCLKFDYNYINPKPSISLYHLIQQALYKHLWICRAYSINQLH